jgi:hypothetical protein
LDQGRAQHSQSPMDAVMTKVYSICTARLSHKCNSSSVPPNIAHLLVK